VLSNGRIADIYFTFMDERIIIEVKTILKHSIITEAITKYWNQCDYLIIAAPPPQFTKPTELDQITWSSPIEEKIGLLHISGKGLFLAKHPQRLREKTGPKP